MDIKESPVLKSFYSPSKEYYPVTMWFWSDKITKKGITRHLEAFAKQKISAFFIHPSGGMDVPYLSDEFFDLVKFAISEAKRLGLKYWIYDELDWPSGSAGGQVIEKDSAFCQKMLVCDEHEAGCAVRVTDCRRGKFICAQRMGISDNGYIITDVTDKCEVETKGDFVNVEYVNMGVTPEKILFFFSAPTNMVVGSCVAEKRPKSRLGYIDSLNAKAVAEFINITHERYKKEIGDEFGKTVMGVFTDEPTTLYQYDLENFGPWNDEIEQEFIKDHGYSIIPYLYAIGYEAKTPMDAKAKDDYRWTVKRLYQDNFMKPISEWCEKNNLMFTGHLDNEELLEGHFVQGDYYGSLDKFHVPGIDSIFSSIKIDYNSFNVAGKLGASIAKYAGRNRFLCETFTGSGHHLRFTGIKRVANRLISLGVNMLMYMGAHYNMDAGRKVFPRAYPPSHSWNNILYPHYNVINDYIASFQAVSAQTVPVSKVLLFDPMRQQIQRLIRMGGEYSRFEDENQTLYEDTINALLADAIPFEIISEEVSEQITVKDGKAILNGYEYECIVLPFMYYVSDKTAALLERLKQGSVKTVFIHSCPGMIVNKAQPIEQLSFKKCFVDGDIKVSDNENTFFVVSKEYPVCKKTYKRVLKRVIGLAALNMETRDNIYLASRENDQYNVYFVSNDDDKISSCEIDADGITAYSADTKSQINYKISNGRMTVCLAPYEMVMLVKSKENADKATDYTPDCKSAKAVYTLKNSYCFEAEGGNQLPLVYEFKKEGMDKWLKCAPLAFPKGVNLGLCEPFCVRTSFNTEFIPDEIFLNIEIRSLKRVSVNGIAVKPENNTWRFSEYDSICDIKELVKKGENIIEAEFETEDNPRYSLPPFMFISGQFELLSDNTLTPCANTIKSGGWDTQGYPYFAGTGIYKTKINIDTDFEEAKISVDTKDAADIYVNGTLAACRVYQPFEAQIGEYLKCGENEIELRITSTYANLLAIEIENPMMKSVHTNNGILGEVKISCF